MATEKFLPLTRAFSALISEASPLSVARMLDVGPCSKERDLIVHVSHHTHTYESRRNRGRRDKRTRKQFNRGKECWSCVKVRRDYVRLTRGHSPKLGCAWAQGLRDRPTGRRKEKERNSRWREPCVGICKVNHQRHEEFSANL